MSLVSRLNDLPRDKADTLLLLAAALMVLAPHMGHLPLWTSAVVLATLACRAAITWRGKRMPPLWLLLPVSLAAMAGVYASYRTLLGRDAGVAMLALLLAFKLLEMHARRDLFVVIFLSFFLLLTTFFYTQAIWMAALMAATVVVLLATLMTFQYTGAVPPLGRRLRETGRIFMIATPLAIFMFIAFPRFQGPLWGLPGDAHSGKSGMSDTMSPGSVSSLALSEEVAFRVRFFGAPPPQARLYWRGIVLSGFDGKTWSRDSRLLYASGENVRDFTIAVDGDALRHDITLEPTGKRWLFSLELTAPDIDVPGGVATSDELELMARQPVNERLRYSARAWVNHQWQADLPQERQVKWLRLPPGYNPRALELAQSLRRPDNPAASVQAVLAMFRREQFRYTLAPPPLGRDTVDDFLFTTRAGFCEHYAAAFTVLMRAMGIPARVINGYQGGELNPVDGYLTVRQSDAHAWAEIWLPQRGWVRIDPTAAVAPERIEHNLARSLPQSAPFGLDGLIGLRNNPDSWLSQLRFGANALNNAWNQWVLDYNPDRQRSFLEELSLGFFNWRGAAGIAAIAALLWLLRRMRRRTTQDPADAAYDAFCQWMAKRGRERLPDEGPHSYALRLQDMELTEAGKAAMRSFLELYGKLKYGRPDARSSASAATLNALLNELIKKN
ncbi:transglutaminase TgpA family protein [Pseudoduganella rivuli]